MMTEHVVRKLDFIKLFLSAAGLVAFASPIAFGQVNTMQSQVESQAQNTDTAAPAYEFDVVSIKPDKSGPGVPNVVSMEDGFSLTNIPIRGLVMWAFGVGIDQILQAPDWLTSERYDIQGKMDDSVAEALKKLSPDNRKLASQHMAEAILKDRCQFQYHRETKDLSVYSLVIAKNGPKIQESKPGETSTNGFKFPNGHGGTGSILVGGRGAVTFQGLPMAYVVQFLSQQLGRPVLDKTGLAGMYDVNLKWTPEQGQFPGRPEGAPNGMAAPSPLDPDGPSLFTAVQEQLGLKLESGKGPVEVIVIDHIERPSEN